MHEEIAFVKAARGALHILADIRDSLADMDSVDLSTVATNVTHQNPSPSLFMLFQCPAPLHQESFSYLNKPASVTGNPRPAVAARSSSADSPDPGTSGAPLTWQHGVGAVAVLAGLACALSTPQAAVYKDMLMESKLGKSGFVAAFSLIFLSELGDKTFFIAAILAMKVGKWISFLGSVSALSLMSFISVAIGHVPEALQSSLPLGEIAGTALLVVFGLRNLQEGMSSNGDDKEKSDEEYSGAESAVKKVIPDNELKGNLMLQHFTP
eukprot:gene26093-11801_t